MYIHFYIYFVAIIIPQYFNFNFILCIYFFLPILDWTEYDGVINLEQKHVHVSTNTTVRGFILKCLD